MSFTSRKTILATWNLKTASLTLAEDFRSLSERSNSNGESTAAPPIDIQEGKNKSNYNAIVNLILRYEGQKEILTHGTGWLVKKDILMTSGQSVYDRRDERLGRAVEIKAYIGHRGKLSLADAEKIPGVQIRTGTKVVTSASWINGEDHKSNNMSFIQLDKPFEGVAPVPLADTRVGNHHALGVVGYPGDKSSNNFYVPGGNYSTSIDDYLQIFDANLEKTPLNYHIPSINNINFVSLESATDPIKVEVSAGDVVPPITSHVELSASAALIGLGSLGGPVGTAIGSAAGAILGSRNMEGELIGNGSLPAIIGNSGDIERAIVMED